jgi:RNA polymerase sigma-70 factor (ECF subfamily)
VDDLTRLWLAARDGHSAALAQAIRSSQADVYRLAVHLVGPGDADDVAQDTFIRAWRALPQFRGESSARTWLLAIARRACADAIRGTVRRRRVRAQYEEQRRRYGAHTDVAPSHALDALVAGLEPDQRAAFVLTQIVGCCYAEAAAICDVPVGTIRSRVARARERLVAELDEADTG